jgi:hypothetical protein
MVSADQLRTDPMSEPSPSPGHDSQDTATARPALGASDPELSALPVPRRPWRRTTLICLGLSGLAALSLMVALRVHVAYALMGGQPVEIGALAQFQPVPSQANTWIHGHGALGSPSVSYRRPLDPDRFRLAPLADNPRIWIEMREPGDSDPAFFVAPESFVGRLTQVKEPGLRHNDLLAALRATGQATPPADAWLLIDGESPASDRGMLGLAALLMAFAGFSIFGLYRLAAPVSARVLE